MTITSLPAAVMGGCLCFPSSRALVLPCREFHGEMHALEGTAFDGQIAGLGRAGTENHGVILAEQPVGGIILADLGFRQKYNSLLFHLFDTPQNQFLVQLHVGDAVHEQAADAVGALENGDQMPGAVALGGGTQTSGTGTDHGHFFPGARMGRFCFDPAFVPSLVNDGAFYVMDRDGRSADAEDAGTFARRRADTTGEVGEIVGLMEAVERFLPQAAIHQIVPFRDQVIDGTTRSHAADERAGVAEGNAAVHAAGALLTELGFLQRLVKFMPVLDAHHGGAIQRQFAKIFQVSGWFTHVLLSSSNDEMERTFLV